MRSQVLVAIDPSKTEDSLERRLTPFDLTWDVVRDRILMRAQAIARPYATELSPPGAAGQIRFIHLVRNLTEVLMPAGWERCDRNNIARLIHPERKLAVVITSGDEVTGTPFSQLKRKPKTKYAKGAAIRRVVEVNDTPPLFDLAEPAEEVDLDEYKTWFLLVHVSLLKIQSELSLAKTLDAKGFINDWIDRILFPDLPNDGTALTDDETSIDLSGDDESRIDISVDPL